MGTRQKRECKYRMSFGKHTGKTSADSMGVGTPSAQSQGKAYPCELLNRGACWGLHLCHLVHCIVPTTPRAPRVARLISAPLPGGK